MTGLSHLVPPQVSGLAPDSSTETGQARPSGTLFQQQQQQQQQRRLRDELSLRSAIKQGADA